MSQIRGQDNWPRLKVSSYYFPRWRYVKWDGEGTGGTCNCNSFTKPAYGTQNKSPDSTRNTDGIISFFPLTDHEYTLLSNLSNENGPPWVKGGQSTQRSTMISEPFSLHSSKWSLPHPPQILVAVWNLPNYTGYQMDSSPWRCWFSLRAGPRFLLMTLWKHLCVADASLYIHKLQVSSWTYRLEFFGGARCPSLSGLEGEVRAGVLRCHLDAQASPSLKPKANRSLNRKRGQG